MIFMFDPEINSCLGSFRQENFCLNVSLVSHYDILAIKCIYLITIILGITKLSFYRY